MTHLGEISAYLRHGMGRRTRHREQIPGVVRVAANDPLVPGGIFWCLDHDLFIITQPASGMDPAVSQTIPAFSYAQIWPGIDSGQTLDIENHAYVIIALPEFPAEYFAVRQDHYQRIAMRKTVVKVAWVDAHFDLFPRHVQTYITHPWSLPNVSATNPTIVSPDDDPGADWYRYGFDDTVWPDAERATAGEVAALGVPSFAHEAVVIHSTFTSPGSGRQAWFHRQYFTLEYVRDGSGILTGTTILLRMAGNADITDIYMNEDHVFTAGVGDHPPDTAYFVDITNKLGGPFPVYNDRVDDEDLIAFRSDLETTGRGTLMWQVILAAQRFSDQTAYILETNERLSAGSSGWNSTEFDDTGWKHAQILPGYTTPVYPDWEDGDFNALASPITPGNHGILIYPTLDALRWQSIDGPQFIEIVGIGSTFSTSSTSQFAISGLGGAHILTQSASDHTHAELFIAQGSHTGTFTISYKESGAIAATADVTVTESLPSEPGPRYLYVRVWFYTVERDDDCKINLDSNGTIANVYMDGQHVQNIDQTGPYVIDGAVGTTYPHVLNKDAEDTDHHVVTRARLLAIEAYYDHTHARPDWLVYVVTPPRAHVEYTEIAVWTTQASGLICVTRDPDGTLHTQTADPTTGVTEYDTTLRVVLPAKPSMYAPLNDMTLAYDTDHIGPGEVLTDYSALPSFAAGPGQWHYSHQFFAPDGTYRDGVIYVSTYYQISYLQINGYDITSNVTFTPTDPSVIPRDDNPHGGSSPSPRFVGFMSSGIPQPTTYDSSGVFTPFATLAYTDTYGAETANMYQYVVGFPAVAIIPNAWNTIDVYMNRQGHNAPAHEGGDSFETNYIRMMGFILNGAYVASDGG